MLPEERRKKRYEYNKFCSKAELKKPAEYSTLVDDSTKVKKWVKGGSDDGVTVDNFVSLTMYNTLTVLVLPFEEINFSSLWRKKVIDL